MSKFITNENEIAIFALGGLGEVGKNSYVFEIENKIFIVDAGVMFPGGHLLGIDYVIPDYQYLVENSDRIQGLFITHAHEDHIGGIPYLLRKVAIPKIFVSGIAAELLDFKLMEFPDIPAPMIEQFVSYSEYDFDGVKVSFIRLNHSIPDMFGICFHTKQGIIFHTGDFKFDLTPVGPHAEYDKLSEIKRKGVLCLLSDSTNAEREELITSESKVGKSISDIFSDIKGRILIATFASNIYRLQQIIEASYKNGRKILVSGRSMERAIEAGVETGYIKFPKGVFMEPEEIQNYHASEIVILLTGSQGEPLAALSRIANGSHKLIKIIPGDTVIFSSSPIPGNLEGINKTVNQLFRFGVEVIQHGPLTDTHASGHASQNDLKLMICLTRPKYFIPVHGEYHMLMTHRALAIDCGVKKENILVLNNGEVAKLTEDEIIKDGTVPSGNVYIDGSTTTSNNSLVVKDRKVLSTEGIIAFIISVDSKNKIFICEPNVISRGFIYMKANEKYTDQLTHSIIDIVFKFMNNDNFNKEDCEKEIKEYLEKKIFENTLRNPIVIPYITDLRDINYIGLEETPQEDQEVVDNN
ncbi:MAG: ribonuclease J [Acholeplasmatales bacterium]|jgi:ribonuclease J|nr:ribonuclease J [Acholeplasmatales bacterium]